MTEQVLQTHVNSVDPVKREPAMGEVELPLRVLAEDGLEAYKHSGRAPSVLSRSSWYCSSASARVKNGLVVQPGRHLPSASPSADPPACRSAALADGPAADPRSASALSPGSISWSRVSLRLKTGLSTTSDLVQLGLERVDQVIPWLLKPQSDVQLGLELPCPPPEEDCLSVCSWSELLDVDVVCSLGDGKEQEQQQQQELDLEQLFKETVRQVYIYPLCTGRLQNDG